MPHLCFTPCSRRSLGVLAAFIAGVVALSGAATGAPPPKKAPPKPTPTQADSKPVIMSVPKKSQLTSEAWQNAPMTPAAPDEIDQLVAKELQHDKIEPAPLTTDEQFLRRVTLDLTGHLPEPADVTEFVADKDSRKRAKLIDKLLETDAYARHWASYWREVISAKVIDRRGMLGARGFEDWLTEQFKSNAGWGQIVKTILTAEGEIRFDQQNGKNGAAFFLGAHLGAEAANDRAAETSRIFLGIQIQCAQCHDHPFDQWQRVQFHELAAYFARLRDRPVRDGMKTVGWELISTPRGEHEMPSKEDPKKTFITYPRFLDGKAGPKDSDKDRRLALANSLTDKSNYWFAGAFVNRMWGELMGQSFYQPVDDMGPKKDAVFAGVLVRMAASFRATNYDVKGLFRTVMNSKTYQRQIRLGEATDQHLHFAAAYPTQLRADALWESLVNALGLQLGGPRPAAPMGPFGGMYGGRGGLEGEFKRIFEYDPSLKADEVEGSIPQALMLMNNPQINNSISARGSNVLARILSSHPKNPEALEMLYMRTLARKPTSPELEKCQKYIQTVGNRTEAFEDLLWALINSTEFQTKR